MNENIDLTKILKDCPDPDCKKAILVDGLICLNCGYDYTLKE